MSFAAPRAAEAQLTSVEGKPAYCFGTTGICVVGGTFTTRDGFFEVSLTDASPIELRLPNDIRFTIPSVRSMRIGTAIATASLDADVGLGFAGRAGPVASLGLAGPSVRLQIGKGQALTGSTFAVGSTTVRKQAGWYYVYASFTGGTTMRLPGTAADVPIPTPADGLSSQLLIGFDPNRPGNMVFYLGGGFTSLLTSQTVVDGSVLFSWGGNAELPLGSFVTSAAGGTTALSIRPTFAAQGTLSLFSGDDGSSSSSDEAPRDPNAQRTRKRKPIPITIAGGIALDIDGDADARPFESFADMRFAGTGVGLTIDDVGLGQSLNVGTGNFFYNPAATNCGEVGQLVARVESVNPSLLAGTPLASFDPGTAGYNFDALACGTASIVRLTAGNVSAGAFPLANVAIGFGRSGVSVQGRMRFLGSDVLLRGTVDGRSFRMRSSAGLSIGERAISNGSLELSVSQSGVRLRLTGYVEISGQRFAIDKTFATPPTGFTLPDVRVRQTVGLPRVDIAGVGGEASITLGGYLRAGFSSGAWSVASGGEIGWDVRTFGPAGSDHYEGSYDVGLSVGSRGIDVRLRPWTLPGTTIVIIPGEERTFGSAYDPPSEELPPLVVGPARAGTPTLASNVRAPAASTALASPRVHAQDAIVTLGGNVEWASGTSLDLLVVLPIGMRPSSTLVFAAMQTPRAAGASPAAVRVLANGEVRLLTPSTTITGISLDGISFTRDPEAGEALTYPSSLTPFADTYEPPSAVGRGPFVRTQGMLKRVGSAGVTQIARLPSGLRRISKTLTFELMTSAGVIQANLGDDGWLTYVTGPTSFTWVSLSGIELSPAPWARRDFATARGIANPSDSFLRAYVHRFGGLVWLQGRVDRAGAQTLLGTLSPSMRPLQTRVFHVTQTNGKSARIDVLPNGEVRLSGHDAENTVSLMGVRFYLDHATDELALLRQALYDFAKGVRNPDMKDAWDSVEDAWLAAVTSATSIATLKTKLRELVGYMNADSTYARFRDEKAAWLAALDAAASPAALARSLLELEPYMERSAMTDTWDDVDSSWRAELEGYAL